MGGQRHRLGEDSRLMVTPEEREALDAILAGIPHRLSIDALRFLLSQHLPPHEFVQASACVDELLVYRIVVPQLLTHS